MNDRRESRSWDWQYGIHRTTPDRGVEIEWETDPYRGLRECIKRVTAFNDSAVRLGSSAAVAKVVKRRKWTVVTTWYESLEDHR